MLPMQIVAGAVDTPVSIELKTGECYNGYLLKADYFMNFLLKDVTITSPDGKKFVKAEKCFVRGNCVKYIRVSEEACNKAEASKQSYRRGRGGYRPRGKTRGG